METFPCNNTKETQEWYDNIECINICRPYLFPDEMREERLLYDEINKEIIQENSKMWKDQNRDHRNELKLANYHKNKKPLPEEQLQSKRKITK